MARSSHNLSLFVIFNDDCLTISIHLGCAMAKGIDQGIGNLGEFGPDEHLHDPIGKFEVHVERYLATFPIQGVESPSAFQEGKGTIQQVHFDSPILVHSVQGRECFSYLSMGNLNACLDFIFGQWLGARFATPGKESGIRGYIRHQVIHVRGAIGHQGISMNNGHGVFFGDDYF